MAGPYGTPRTWSAGERPTAAQFNAEFRDWIAALANPPACRVYRASSQAINSGALTAVTFDTERYDTDTMHSTSVNTSRVTFTTAGLYEVGANLSWQADTDYTRRIAYLQVNAAAIIARISDESTHSLANAEEWNLKTTWKMAAADYVELVVYQTNTSNNANNIVAASAYSPEIWATRKGAG